MTAYNPMSYHNGSVWPHDTAICAAGLMHYGFVAEATRIAESLIDAAAHFAHRLPELFCGFPREWFHRPVPYPAACSPQAWASAAPLLLLRNMLRVDPGIASRVADAPDLPGKYLPLTLRGIRIGSATVTIEAGPAGLRVERS
jgi:glycogen debranching enzyme